jgi:hypothetical protein
MMEVSSTSLLAVPPITNTGWGGMLGGLVGGSYQRVRRFISDHRKGRCTPPLVRCICLSLKLAGSSGLHCTTTTTTTFNARSSTPHTTKTGLLCLAVTGGVAAYAVYRVGRGYRELQETSLHRLRYHSDTAWAARGAKGQRAVHHHLNSRRCLLAGWLVCVCVCVYVRARARLRGAFESTQSTCAGTVGSLVGKLNEAVLRLVPIPSTQDLRLRCVHESLTFLRTRFHRSRWPQPAASAQGRPRPLCALGSLQDTEYFYHLSLSLFSVVLAPAHFLLTCCIESLMIEQRLRGWWSECTGWSFSLHSSACKYASLL